MPGCHHPHARKKGNSGYVKEQRGNSTPSHSFRREEKWKYTREGKHFLRLLHRKKLLISWAWNTVQTHSSKRMAWHESRAFTGGALVMMKILVVCKPSLSNILFAVCVGCVYSSMLFRVMNNTNMRSSWWEIVLNDCTILPFWQSSKNKCIWFWKLYVVLEKNTTSKNTQGNVLKSFDNYVQCFISRFTKEKISIPDANEILIIIALGEWRNSF